MSETFKAVVADEVDGKQIAEVRDLTLADLPDEDVLVDIAYSTVNYKDGLAVTGAGQIITKFPMVCGIDLAGTVAESKDPSFAPGDKVLVNGYGLSERHWGGYSQKQRLKGEWLVRVPDAFSLEESMAIGTAGYTSMLSVMAIQDHGIKPGDGPILVTGASGGVGSVAVTLLADLGYEVAASTGRIAENGDYLKSLGASELVERSALSDPSKPLEAERWAAAVDNVGDQTLATILAQLKYEGIVAACGLAGGMGLPATVLPFLLRGITLRGIDSVMAPMARRQRAWDLLAAHLDTSKLKDIYTVAPLDKAIDLTAQILQGTLTGRVVIDVNG